MGEEDSSLVVRPRDIDEDSDDGFLAGGGPEAFAVKLNLLSAGLQETQEFVGGAATEAGEALQAIFERIAVLHHRTLRLEMACGLSSPEQTPREGGEDGPGSPRSARTFRSDAPTNPEEANGGGPGSPRGPRRRERRGSDATSATGPASGAASPAGDPGGRPFPGVPLRGWRSPTGAPAAGVPGAANFGSGTPDGAATPTAAAAAASGAPPTPTPRRSSGKARVGVPPVAVPESGARASSREEFESTSLPKAKSFRRPWSADTCSTCEPPSNREKDGKDDDEEEIAPPAWMQVAMVNAAREVFQEGAGELLKFVEHSQQGSIAPLCDELLSERLQEVVRDIRQDLSASKEELHKRFEEARKELKASVEKTSSALRGDLAADAAASVRRCEKALRAELAATAQALGEKQATAEARLQAIAQKSDLSAAGSAAARKSEKAAPRETPLDEFDQRLQALEGRLPRGRVRAAPRSAAPAAGATGEAQDLAALPELDGLAAGLASLARLLGVLGPEEELGEGEWAWHRVGRKLDEAWRARAAGSGHAHARRPPRPSAGGEGATATTASGSPTTTRSASAADLTAAAGGGSGTRPASAFRSSSSSRLHRQPSTGSADSSSGGGRQAVAAWSFGEASPAPSRR
eukprot:TRINITY_DN20679_c0_g1_i1.p1 TRINITY_DN20679_c0_g1~~TRINITY_DN20679_c0_g1_i1.p1  ORF type:complete len:668 (+),score=141.37 TRINITY_DN20679_c0_g1_i1:101-2005(+)